LFLLLNIACIPNLDKPIIVNATALETINPFIMGAESFFMIRI
jgi:hypothetical protein